MAVRIEAMLELAKLGASCIKPDAVLNEANHTPLEFSANSHVFALVSTVPSVFSIKFDQPSIAFEPGLVLTTLCQIVAWMIVNRNIRLCTEIVQALGWSLCIPLGNAPIQALFQVG
jgi:hypothetical protein